MKLYFSTNLNPRVAVAVARYLGSPVEFVRASPRDPRFEDSFRLINPNALVPVLVEGDSALWETDAIACRLSGIAGVDFWPTGALLPETVKWLSWSRSHLTAAGEVYYFENIVKPKYLAALPDQRVIEAIEEDFHRYAKVLDDILGSRRWLIDDRLTYADFRAATIMPFAQEARMPVEGYNNILEWAGRLDDIEAWRAPFSGLI
jgi:glutathione S-transferase